LEQDYNRVGQLFLASFANSKLKVCVEVVFIKKKLIIESFKVNIKNIYGKYIIYLADY